MVKYYGFDDGMVFGGGAKTRANGGVGRRGGGRQNLTPAQIRAHKATLRKEAAQVKKELAAKKAAAKRGKR